MEEPTGVVSTLIETVDIVGEIFEIIGVVIIVVGFIIATWLFLGDQFKRRDIENAVGLYKVRIGRAMLLGLEVLIAADIVETVAGQATTSDLIGLGLIVLIRTVLSWTLELEIEGRWPWQSKTE